MTDRNLAGVLDALCARGQYRTAARALFARAEAGDPEALEIAGFWRISGAIISRDLGEARRLFDKAGRAGRRDAARYHAYFLAAGIGGGADWDTAIRQLQSARPDDATRRQLNLLAKCDIDRTGRSTRKLAIRRLSESPWVTVCDDFATAAECDYLIDRAAPKLQPSLVIDPSTGALVPNPIRRSDGMMFGVLDEDLVVNAFNRRIAALSNTTFQQGEALQVLRYQAGGEYRAHLDAVPHTDNQRIATVLVYLNDDYAGGETQFVSTGLNYKGQKGAALLFRNVLADGSHDPAALHAGLPVARGSKLIASRWIRARPLIFPAPRPLVSEPV